MGVEIRECDVCHNTFHAAMTVGAVTFRADWRRWGPGKTTHVCPQCARAIHRAYDESLRRRMVCKHAICDGMYCPDCEREYREARR